MRCMRRWKRPLWYALFDRADPHVDEYGNLGGEQDVYYQNPVPLKANVSPAKNTDIVQLFGVDVNYDKALVIDNPDTPIDEHAVLWVDRMPEINPDGSTDTPYDYVVRRVARSLNYAVIALGKVDVRYE